MVFPMPAIPHAAKALTSAFGRLEHSGFQLLGAVNGAAASGGAGDALADLTMAKTDVRAAVAVIRFSDEMQRALLDVLSRPR